MGCSCDRMPPCGCKYRTACATPIRLRPPMVSPLLYGNKDGVRCAVAVRADVRATVRAGVRAGRGGQSAGGRAGGRAGLGRAVAGWGGAQSWRPRRADSRGNVGESGRVEDPVPAYVSGSVSAHAILGANTPTQRGGSKSPRPETVPSSPSSRQRCERLSSPVIVDDA